ncbi:hypothetical protein LSH36_447g05018 [Paralvinella palmiformis]|uniref:G-protein coupled receptors family 1 profile domain-containing protein n=1 Tax=Paralvinella palmiformis TaxID=53620 RepID=A0AAD9JB73_9ANNE|nr:hypothetical protein LSH36_447g05018 [Paralvinella palmiformis]
MADHLMNVSLINGSDYQLPEDLVWLHFQKHFPRKTFDPGTQAALVTAFSALILFGATGNGLVCYVVARNAQMRTPRNIFIINLAISDLTLCIFTQPFNLMHMSLHMWPLGNFMCKFVPMFAGTNVFVSTISITAIALDRFQVIVYPTKDSMKKVGAAVALVSIWIISLLMASPLLIFNRVKALEMPGYGVFFHNCIEREDLHLERGAYSIASMVFQYIVPIVIVSVAHARICRKLKYRMVNQQAPSAAVSSPFQKRRQVREIKRKRKTNLLLVMIAVVFSLSWMPLNVCNIIADFEPQLLQFTDEQTGQLIFAICHMLVLSSACTNPVLYGWLNENFRREFVKVLCARCPGSERGTGCCGRGVSQAAAPQSSVVLYANKQTNGTTYLELVRQTVVQSSEFGDTSSANNIEAV